MNEGVVAGDAFPGETRAFLEGIAAHSEKAWFEAHRGLYEAGYVAPAKAFVEAMGPRLRRITPDVQFEPKINGSISRINRDVRFSNDKRPYKDHLAIYFWLGEKKSFDQPGFYLSIGPKSVWVGSGIYMFDKLMLGDFREAAIYDRSGKELTAILGKLERAGYIIGEKRRKLVPRGFDKDHPRAELLLFEGLHAGAELPLSAAFEPGFADLCLKHFKATWPISRWILAELSA